MTLRIDRSTSKSSMAQPSYLSLADAATRLNVSECTIRRLISAGTLTAFRVGKRLIRLDPAQLDAMGMRTIPSAKAG